MAGRHRRPNRWRRTLARATSRRTGVRAARVAALEAEVLALRATVTTLRSDLDAALAHNWTLHERLAEQTATAAPPPAGLTIELPLMRLALERVAEPPLTREMAVALAAPDRGADTAEVRILLGDLPERRLLDPVEDRESDLRDLAAEIASAPEIVRRTA